MNNSTFCLLIFGDSHRDRVEKQYAQFKNYTSLSAFYAQGIEFAKLYKTSDYVIPAQHTQHSRLCRNSETFAQLHKTSNYVIPAKAGIQYYQALPGFRFSPE